MPLPSNKTNSSSATAGYVAVADTIADGLRDDILAWRLKPGDWIRQEAIARRYRASRMPVRQALLRLETEGLVTFTSHVGARVTTLTLADLDELYRLRERLEPLAVGESTLLLSGDQLAELAALERELREVGEADRPALDRPGPALAPAELCRRAP